jgi:hypothetical protein
MILLRLHQNQMDESADCAVVSALTTLENINQVLAAAR